MVVEIGCGDGWIVGVEINLLNGFPDCYKSKCFSGFFLLVRHHEEVKRSWDVGMCGFVEL